MKQSPLFAALLTPHRALDKRGIHVVVAIYAALAAIPAIYFFVKGAWPVIGFLGLDALILWWALSASLKSGEAFEEVTLWPDTLEVRHVAANGRENNHAFNPFWVRLHIVRDDEDRVIRIALRHRDQELEIGAFLNPDDKDSFATIFGQALSKTK